MLLRGALLLPRLVDAGTEGVDPATRGGGTGVLRHHACRGSGGDGCVGGLAVLGKGLLFHLDRLGLGTNRLGPWKIYLKILGTMQGAIVVKDQSPNF